MLADVSGKGIPAALLMANLQATLRSQCQRSRDDLATLAQLINRFFYDSSDPEHFATAFLAEYDDELRRLRYVNCGHNAPLLMRASGETEELDPTGTVIGAFVPFRCEMAETTLAGGDLLVVCSDGVLEARDDADEQFGACRLAETLRRHPDVPVAELPVHVADAVAGFSAYGQEDDLTLIIARGL